MKRMLTAALAVCLALALALPGFAAHESAVITDVRTAVDVHDDGSAYITNEMDVTFSGESEFTLDFHTGWDANGAKVSAVEASGAPNTVSTIFDDSFTVSFDTSGLDSATLTVSYYYATYDDLEPDRDVMLVPLMAFSRDARVSHVTATVTLPDGLAPTDVRAVDSLYVANSLEATPLDASISTDGGTITVETHETMNEWEDLCLALEFAPGALGQRELGLDEGVRVTESTCDVDVSPERVYSVYQSVTIEVDRDSAAWTLYLPLLETSDSWNGCTYDGFEFRTNDGGAEFDADWNSVVFSLDDGESTLSGTFAFEYTYTLTPRAITEYEQLYLPTVYGADTTENMTFTLRAPGLTGARTFLSAIVSTPKSERFDISCTPGSKDTLGELTVRTLGPMYDDESMTITPQWDETLFSRTTVWPGAIALALTALVLAAVLAASRRRKAGVPDGPASPGAADVMTAAEAGYLCDGVVSTAELGALVVSWAASGAAEIVPQPDGGVLAVRRGAPGPDAPEWERRFFEEIFREPAVAVRSLRGRLPGAARDALAGVRARRAFDPKGARTARLCATLAAVIPGIGAAHAGLALGGGILALASGALALALSAGAAAAAFSAARPSCALAQSPARKTARVLLGLCALALSCALGAWLTRCGIVAPLAWAAALASAACAACAARLCVPSYETFDDLCALRGLSRYLAGASKEELEALLAEDKNAFYRLLPYAVAMGLYDPWVARFEGLRVPVNLSFAGARDCREAAQLAARTVLEVREALR